jgi:lactoylglutathione lyase
MMKDWAERKPSIVFECENIQQTFAAMRDRGFKFTQEPKAMPWGRSRSSLIMTATSMD